MRRIATLVLALSVLGCAVPPDPVAVAPPEAPMSQIPPPEPPPAKVVAPRPRPRPPAPDTCGARELQYLVGRPRNEIPVPINPGGRRVTCTTCPMTLDFNPQRVNILFEAETGLIKEVKCG